MIPGSNLLKTAFRVIAKYTVLYSKYTGRTTNDAGFDVSAYDTPVQMKGSLQVVPRTLYEQYGLNFEKTYYTFYTPNNILVTGRDVAGDKFQFNDQTYHCEADNNWFIIDGWTGVLCILDT